MKDYLSHKGIQHSWNTIANSFDRTRKKPWKPVIDYLSTLSEHAVVGDFGCGNGRHTVEIAKKCQKAIGIDISINLLKIVQMNLKIYPNVDLIHAHLSSIPLRNDSLDGILFIASLHNIPKKRNRVHSLKETYRVLKRNGRMLLSVWNLDKDFFYNRYDNVQLLNIDKSNLEPGDVFIFWNQDKLHIPRYYHLYEEDEIKDEVESVGFHIESLKRIRLASTNHPENYFLILKKNR